MKFSTIFKVTPDENDNWFDPILKKDTKLFIDPFLIFDTKDPLFIDCHKKTIDFFENGFEIAAVSKPNDTDIRYKQLKRMMSFPEVAEICLGYAESDTGGSGAGGRKSSRDRCD